MNHVNTVYDYIVVIRATERDGKFEEYRQTIQALIEQLSAQVLGKLTS